MNVPQSDKLTTARLGRVFSNKTATYKFFWFLSILQIHARTGNLRMNIWEIVARMVANAWYPIHYFRLSFGKGDSLFKIVTELQRITNIPIDAKADIVADGLANNIENPLVRNELATLTKNVPYRFLSPWIQFVNEEDVIKRSKNHENECLYSLQKDNEGFYIEINSVWDSYLHCNYQILVEFIYWNLTQFLQIRNPNVPSIPNKLTRPETRRSLNKQHKYWDAVIEYGGSIRCIYTNKPIQNSYALDHFIPWRFITHDLIWNLIPADCSINSSKSDKLPPLDVFLPKLAALQRYSICTAVKTGRRFDVLDDYISLGHSISELIAMPNDAFLTLMYNTFEPHWQFAQNIGFETWKDYNHGT